MMLRVGVLGKGQGRRRLHEVGEGLQSTAASCHEDTARLELPMSGGRGGLRREGGLGDDEILCILTLATMSACCLHRMILKIIPPRDPAPPPLRSPHCHLL